MEPTIRTSMMTQWDLTDNAWLPIFSNFTPCNIEVIAFGEKLQAKSGEHAFQAFKTLDHVERKMILSQLTAAKAKKAGRRATLRKGWDDGISIEVMERVVVSRISQDMRFKEALLSTKGRNIIEVTRWNDRFWGTDEQGTGANVLGQLLMTVRDFDWGEDHEIR